MNITNSTSIRVADSPTRRHRIRRHSVTVRITHWINVLCFSIMLLSGLQIFNAHPRLYWGQYGADTEHALLEIGSQQRDDGTH